MKIYVCDGSFDGILTAVFEAFELKEFHVQLVYESFYQLNLLDQVTHIISDTEKAQRVWKGLRKKLPADWQNKFYYSFLSEQAVIGNHLFQFAIYVFQNTAPVYQNYGNDHVITLAQMAKSVSRERHRMKAFIRFEKTLDGMFYQKIAPDFNVLPLIGTHFKNRYADQQWLIYDEVRHYGIFYNLHTVEEVTFDFNPQPDESVTESEALVPVIHDAQEGLYAQLWKDYFKSTNIPARKNMKLHLQHVPRRYWRYLTEKPEHGAE